MRFARVMSLFVIASLSMSMMSITSAPPAEAHHRAGPCPVHWHFTQLDKAQDAARRLIRCATRRWSVPGGYRQARDVARCESGLRWWADGGSSAGLFQHLHRYWPGRARRFLRDRWDIGHSIWNARAQAIVTMRMVHASGSWSAWSCA